MGHNDNTVERVKASDLAVMSETTEEHTLIPSIQQQFMCTESRNELSIDEVANHYRT